MKYGVREIAAARSCLMGQEAISSTGFGGREAMLLCSDDLLWVRRAG